MSSIRIAVHNQAFTDIQCGDSIAKTDFDSLNRTLATYPFSYGFTLFEACRYWEDVMMRPIGARYFRSDPSCSNRSITRRTCVTDGLLTHKLSASNAYLPSFGT